MGSKRVEIDFVPDRCGPVIAVHNVLFQVVPPVDMESDTFIVLAGETKWNIVGRIRSSGMPRCLDNWMRVDLHGYSETTPEREEHRG